MFTGLVEEQLPVTRLDSIEGGIRIGIDASLWGDEVSIGESIALNGCCLTVVELNDGTIEFEAGEETLSKTTLGSVRPGELVNAERAPASRRSNGGPLGLRTC